MSELSKLTYQDIQAIFTIIGECRELGLDAIEWRMHLFQRLQKLLHADVVIGGELACNATGVPAPTVSLDVGFDAPDDIHYQTLLETEPQVIGSLVMPLVQRAVQGDPAVTRERSQLITDDAWYGSRFFPHVTALRGQSAFHFSAVFEASSHLRRQRMVGCFFQELPLESC
jgi:hypothetical protein